MRARLRAAGWARLARPSSWTLRSKLVASTVALFLAVSAATGLAAALALQSFLMGQLSDQVLAASERRVGGLPDGGGQGGSRGTGGAGQSRQPAAEPGGPANRGGPPPGLGGGYLSVTLDGGTVVSSEVRTASGELSALTAAQVALIQAADLGPDPAEVDLGGQLGTYLLAAARRSGGGTAYVSGLAVEPVTSTVRQMSLILAVLTGVGLVAVATGGTWLVRRNLRPLRRVAATATRVAQLPLHRGEVALAERVPVADTDPRTEIGQVGVAVNTMLDHVGAALEARHESEQRVRQFVADASHELRTPLASIRGYAELSRREREPVPAGVVHALGRVEAEAVRMTSLVDDLLLLARLDAGRPLDREPVDIAMIVVDAVSDAHAASPDHKWRLAVPDDPAYVSGDRARLHQVVANLLANARTHTPPGTTVVAEVSVSGGEVRVSVTDDGPGVPVDLQPHVFQRFARGDASRSRAEGSTGLGLSIVQAVTAAHGGRVGLESRPGQTRFIVALPA